MQNLKIIQGHVIPALKSLPADYVDTIVTSPPYWGLRDYGKESVTIWDAEEECEHEWGEEIRKGISGGMESELLHLKNKENFQIVSNSKHAFCQKCGAWRGQLGLEPSLDLYLQHLLQITAELKRVLKPSGTLFWNHGDSYGGSGGSGGDYNEGGLREGQPKVSRSGIGITAKCMCLQNYRFIQHMTDEQGWILRNVIIWNKPNHMPSSVEDRFTSSHEPIFMLTKNNKPLYYWNEKTGLMANKPPPERIEGKDWEWQVVGGGYSIGKTKIGKEEAELFASPQARVYRKTEAKEHSFWHSLDYWFDLDAVREPFMAPLNRWGGNNVKIPEKTKWNDAREKERWQMSIRDRKSRLNLSGKNPGDVWTFSTQPFPEAHFAVFSEELPERAIKCSCPREICAECGKARVRITKSHTSFESESGRAGNKPKGKYKEAEGRGIIGKTLRMGPTSHVETIGWTDCGCNAEYKPGIVLDPFLGSGTTMKVARELGRSCIGIEINPEYVKIAKNRVKWNEGFVKFELEKMTLGEEGEKVRYDANEIMI
jgi:DNA modification methylase